MVHSDPRWRENDEPNLREKRERPPEIMRAVHWPGRKEVMRANEEDDDDDVGSVAALRGWLGDFGQQHKEHFTRSRTMTPVPPTKKTRSITSRHSVCGVPSSVPRSMTGRPRFSIRVPGSPENVQATDDGYASVAKLSKWLANDPTRRQTKLKPLRRGANVIAKSRKFDKGLAARIVEEENLAHGHVSSRAEWLEKQSNSSTTGTEEGSVVAASTYSVQDKRKWLNEAFLNETTRSVVERAQSEIVSSRDGVSSRAKELWRTKRSAAKSPKKQAPESIVEETTENLTIETEQDDAAEQSIPKVSTPETLGTEAMSVDESVAEPEKRDDEQDAKPSSPPVDFKSAKRLLMERSRTNGHNVFDMTSQVQRRRAKFEKMAPKETSLGKAQRNRCTSRNYVKSYVADICPKKGFEELPWFIKFIMIRSLGNII